MDSKIDYRYNMPMIKYLLIISFTFFASISATAESIDEYLTPESIEEALEKAKAELLRLKIDEPYLASLGDHYSKNILLISTGNFVKYYLVGTCDLHELIAIAQFLETDTATLTSIPGEPDYQSHNRIFFERFLTVFYKN